jgi:hypothetical protein
MIGTSMSRVNQGEQAMQDRKVHKVYQDRLVAQAIWHQAFRISPLALDQNHSSLKAD